MSASATVSAGVLTARSRPVIVLLLCAAANTYGVLQSLVVPAIGTLQTRLHIGATGAAWVFTTYLLSASVFTPVIGRLGDLYGKRRTLLWSMSVMAVGAVVSGFADNLTLMIIGRIGQGAGGAIFPLAFATVRDLLPARERAKAIATLSAVITVSGALGTIVAGPIIVYLSYHWLFWLPAVFTAVSALGVALLMPETARVRAARISPVSALLFAGWLTALLLAITLLAGPHWIAVGALGAAAAILAVLWWRREVRTAHPLVDVRTLRLPAVTTTNVATLLLGFGMFGAWLLVPLLVQQDPGTGIGLGASATAVGLYMLPQALGVLVATRLLPPLRVRLGMRTVVVAGGLIAALAYGWVAIWNGPVSLGAAMFVEGVGIGLAWAAVALLSVESVPADQTGVAAGINTINRTVGGTLGTVVAGTLLAAITLPDGVPAPASYAITFGAFALSLVGCAAVGCFLPAGRPDAGEEPAGAEALAATAATAAPAAS